MALYTLLEAAAFTRVAEAYGLGDGAGGGGHPRGLHQHQPPRAHLGGRFFVRHTTVRSAEDLRFEAACSPTSPSPTSPRPRCFPTLQGQPFLELEGGRVSVFTWLVGEELRRAAAHRRST